VGVSRSSRDVSIGWGAIIVRLLGGLNKITH
jgi:hypothetical protein